jgi:hypothetical protein
MVPGVSAPTVVAVDWSGAKQPNGIWLAAIRDGGVEDRPIRKREDAIEAVMAIEPPVVAGFDFSFGVPAWFARELGCETGEDVWHAAAEHGEQWLRPTEPFWNDRCTLSKEQRFRRCELRYPGCKSVFQLVGNGQVGPGSVRGMPFLRDLRAAGFAIWPFDAATERTVVEIYPKVLLDVCVPPQEFGTNDQRDAVMSALAMWRSREDIMRLRAAQDAVTLLEGDIWCPATACP